MRVPTAKIKERVTIIGRCVQAEWERHGERGGVHRGENEGILLPDLAHFILGDN